MSVIAEAMIAKILRECKDYRSDKDAKVDTAYMLVDSIVVHLCPSSCERAGHSWIYPSA